MTRSLAPALLSVLALTHLAVPRDAEACSLPESGLSLWVEAAVPTDGAVLIRVSCYYQCEDPGAVKLKVLDNEGHAIAGTIILSRFEGGDNWFTWRPETPFEVGEYTIEFEHPDKQPSAPAVSFEVTNDAPRIPTELQIETESYARVVGPELCCAGGIADSCGGLPCYTVPESVVSQHSLSLYFPTDGIRLSSLLYRSRFGEGSWSDWSPSESAGISFEEEVVDEYCYEVEVRDLRTDTTEALFSGCVPASEFGPADTEGALADANRNLFRYCTDPPEDYEARWCETFAENIRTGVCEDYDEACKTALAKCPPVDETDPTGSGGTLSSSGGSTNGIGGGAASSGGKGSGGEPDETDDGPGGPPGSDDEKSTGTNVRACSYGGPGASPGSLPWFLAVAALFRLSRRRAKPSRING